MTIIKLFIELYNSNFVPPSTQLYFNQNLTILHSTCARLGDRATSPLLYKVGGIYHYQVDQHKTSLPVLVFQTILLQPLNSNPRQSSTFEHFYVEQFSCERAVTYTHAYICQHFIGRDNTKSTNGNVGEMFNIFALYSRLQWRSNLVWIINEQRPSENFTCYNYPSHAKR